MKYIALFSCVLLSITCAQASQFAPLRYDDNFSEPPDSDNFYAAIKHIDIGAQDRYLSFGGDIRERIEYYNHTNLGPRAVDDDSFLLHRLLMHVDAHWDGARVFVQLGNHEESGRRPNPKPTDVDHADVQQAFVDYQFSLTENSSVTLRGGRQEMVFGASRLIAVREGPNIHISYDGARLQWRSREWEVTGIAVRPVEIDPGQFDDKATHAQSLKGVYATYRFAALENYRTDFYYFDSFNDAVHYDSIAGDERRKTFGLRIYGRFGALDSDVELIVQNGAVAGDSIRAFALATDNGWTWRQATWAPRLGLRTDIISGDRNAHDRTLQTFNALYPNGSYFSEASLIAQANLLDFTASLAVQPIPAVTVTWSINPLWRYSTEDALYTLPLSPLIAGNSSDARYIGVQNQLLGVWRYNDFLSFRAAVVRFNAGTFVRQGGGHDIDYAQLATSLRF